jgi:S-adenosylmethionine hydrolase
MFNLITLTTDFGATEYAAVLKGVIFGINPDVRIIDINHNIRAQDVIQGAYVLYSALPYFPSAVHVGVVDPGVGTTREGLVIQCERGVLVGPDNGLLIPSARKLGLNKVYKITNKNYLLDSISHTFHGRDVFAPVAAHLSLGVKTEDIGEDFKDYVDLELEQWEEKEGELRGKFLTFDGFGNIISSIPKEVVLKHLKFNDEIEIHIVGKNKNIIKNVPFLPSYGHQEAGQFLATISSSNFFEIAVNSGSVKKELDIDGISDIVIRI